MKIKIESDVFDIVNRVKDIDEGYYILYNQTNNNFELHNKYQKNTYCLTIPIDSLDSRVIDMIMYTNISNIDNIMIDIDNNNLKIEKENDEIIKNLTDYKVREIYNFANSSSKYLGEDLFTTVWR